MQRNELARLLDDARLPERLGSYAGIARAARRKGHSISKQRVQQLAEADPLPSIVPKNVRAISAALEIPTARVVAAVIDAAGLPQPVQPEDWTPETAIRFDPVLPSVAKQMLLLQIEAARQRAGLHGISGPPVPDVPPPSARKPRPKPPADGDARKPRRTKREAHP